MFFYRSKWLQNSSIVVQPCSVVERVVSLPLVSSTYGLVSSVYANTKDNHPYLKTACEVAEQGVRTITSVALNTASPILDKLEPQIAIANDLACKGLDRIEKTLPILHHPSEQVCTGRMSRLANTGFRLCPMLKTW
uniref:Perilipin 2 n=1 Tax=Neogobius melanostomus TaxID=47308 RepID=A0A8C6T8S5_9GOBI